MAADVEVLTGCRTPAIPKSESQGLPPLVSNNPTTAASNAPPRFTRRHCNVRISVPWP